LLFLLSFVCKFSFFSISSPFEEDFNISKKNIVVNTFSKKFLKKLISFIFLMI